MRLVELLDPIFKLLPEVKTPEVSPPLNKKLMWSFLAILLFFIMGQITVIGLQTSAAEQLQLFQQILASKIGTLITVGIGPIVLASIVLQLLVGGKFINLDFSNPLDRARFTSLQKLLAIIFCFFEAAAYAGFGIFPALIQPMPGMFLAVVCQIALGSIILLYLDEVVSKYGVGSGIGLFIACGVAGSFFWRLFAPPMETAQGMIGGRIWDLFNYLTSGQFTFALPILMSIFFVILIFLAVVFVEGIRVNIPLIIGTRGFGGKFPVKFLYVSNMPVILTMALYANVQIWANFMKNTPLLGSFFSLLSWITEPPRISGMIYLEGLIVSLLNPAAVSLQTILFETFHAFIYLIFLIALCILFGVLWIELANQGPEQVAKQLQQSGLAIPGFRRDPRVIRSVLDRYIPPITVLGSAFVGLLAGISSLATGALVSGIGILLTVGIIYRLYEELAREQVLASSELFRKLVGRM